MALSSDVVFHGIQHFPAVSGRQLPDRLDLTSMSVNEQRPDMKEDVLCHSMLIGSVLGGSVGRCRPCRMVDSDC